VIDPDVADAMARSFLGKLPSGLVDELLAEGERVDYPAGSIIYREGAAPRAVLVVEGLLRVYMTSPEGRQVTVRYARDAEVLGIAVLPSTRSVRCGSGGSAPAGSGVGAAAPGWPVGGAGVAAGACRCGRISPGGRGPCPA
jgi:CRP-like cAMP-binding protein